MDEIEKLPYASWLEETVCHLVHLKPKAISVSAILDDGNVMTGYYEADPTQMAVMAHNIQMDSIMDSLLANIDLLRDALGIESDDSEDENCDDE